MTEYRHAVVLHIERDQHNRISLRIDAPDEPRVAEYLDVAVTAWSVGLPVDLVIRTTTDYESGERDVDEVTIEPRGYDGLGDEPSNADMVQVVRGPGGRIAQIHTAIRWLPR